MRKVVVVFGVNFTVVTFVGFIVRRHLRHVIAVRHVVGALNLRHVAVSDDIPIHREGDCRVTTFQHKSVGGNLANSIVNFAFQVDAFVLVVGELSKWLKSAGNVDTEIVYIEFDVKLRRICGTKSVSSS